MRLGFIFGLVICGCVSAAGVGAQQAQTPADPAVILKIQQEQTAQLASTWLHSGDPRMQAWGAYVVLRDKHTQLIPDLLALADAYEVTGLPVLNTRREQHDAMLAILDTLIQVDASVTGDESKRLYSEFPAQSLIMLSRAWIYPDSLDSSNAVLLELFRAEHSQLAWLAAGNILAARKAEGFAAAVLGNMTVHMNLLVTSPNQIVGGSGESWCGDSFPGPPEDRSAWPEIGTYALAESGAGATLLADGADPAYYKRKVGRRYGSIEGGAQCGSGTTYRWDELRQHYVARMLGAPQDEPLLKASVYRTVIWENGQAYLAQLRGFVQQQQLAFAEVAGKLRDACLMTAEEVSAVKPHLEITIVDDREDKTPPLPRVENLGDNVTIKM
jgi:hypothetical protein